MQDCIIVSQLEVMARVGVPPAERGAPQRLTISLRMEPERGLAELADNLGNTIDYAQRSRVADIDATYQLSKWLSVGGKYAIRDGDLKPTQTEGDWFADQAQLWILRADVLFPRQWDAMIELRRLSVRETDDHRTGFLLGGYRHVGDHVKIGAGYNFTNYSDELTDASYRSHGFFVNMIGKF